MWLNRIIFFFVFMGLCGVMQAQHWQTALRKAAEKSARVETGKETAQLAEAVESALQKKQTGGVCFFSAERISQVNDFLGKDIGPWLTGWVEKNNRLAISRLLFKAHLAQYFVRHQTAILQDLMHAPLGNAENWAKNIAPEAKIIFVGEYHLPYIQTQVAALLKAYQRLYPARQIIVLTEFAEDSYPRFLSVPNKTGEIYLEKFFAAFPKRNIRTAGLEERACLNTYVKSSDGLHISGSLLGVTVRNAHWYKRIEQWRRQYPQAVFFVYVGEEHCSLDELSSLSRRFSPDESFVISFLPSGYKKLIQKEELFHAVTQEKFYTPGILLWKNRRKRRLVGFDMQIILPQRNIHSF